MFYLAMEEYVARHRELGEAVFFWSVAPTVIFGRNQVMSAEVNLPWCREHGVQTYRRKSGGGCVYSDEGNLMISYVSSDTEVDVVFGRYLSRLSEALRSLGADASVSGRNDVMIGGKKVSGNAFQLLGDRSIVHGTLLYDSDFDALVQAITPSESKVSSKGVASVHQHVTNLKPHLAQGSPVHDMESLVDYLAGYLCNGTIVLDEAAIEEISEIEKTYLDPAFIAGNEAEQPLGRHISEEAADRETRGRTETLCRKARIPDVGETAVDIVLKSGRIDSVHLSGDYFALAAPEQVDAALSQALRGLPLETALILNALQGIEVEKLVAHLTAASLTGLLLD